HGIPATKLFRFPGAQRLQAVRGEDERNAIQLLGEITRHRHVPRMRVDNVDAGERLYLCQIQTERFKRAFEFLLRAVRDFAPGLGAAHVKVSVIGVLIAPAVYFYLDLLREFAAQIVDMNACAAVYIRRVLTCK